MKKSISILLLLFFAAHLPAQIKVTFIVKEHTAIEHDSIFITGSFSNWDSTANPIYLMKPHVVGSVPHAKAYNATDLIQDQLDQGNKVIAHPINEHWIDIGRHEDLERAAWNANKRT